MERLRNMDNIVPFKARRQTFLKNGTDGQPIASSFAEKNTWIPVVVGGKEYLPDGLEVESRVLNPIRKLKARHNVKRHEALHAYVGEGTGSSVEKVSVVPNYQEHYEGITVFNEFNDAAAIAADEDGEDGAGSDVQKVRYFSPSEGAARVRARRVIANGEEHIQAIGGLLEEKPTISGNEVRRIIKRVDEGDKVSVQIRDRNGNEKTIQKDGVKGEIIMLPGKLFILEPSEAPSNISQFPQNQADSLAA